MIADACDAVAKRAASRKPPQFGVAKLFYANGEPCCPGGHVLAALGAHNPGADIAPAISRLLSVPDLPARVMYAAASVQGANDHSITCEARALAATETL